MAIEDLSSGSFLYARIRQLGLGLADDAADVIGVALANRFQDVAWMNAEKPLLQILRDSLQRDHSMLKWITPFGRNFLHGESVIACAKECFARGVERVQFDGFYLETGEREPQRSHFL